MRVATFNLRTPTPLDGRDRWAKRKGFAAEVVIGLGADVIGLQECVRHQADFLANRLGGYDWFGTGRDKGGGGEMAPLFWRADRLEMLGGGHFWMSRTPGEPGSRSWLTAWPRMATWADFRDGGGLEFRAFNTHLSVASGWARRRSADLLANRVAACGLPCVVLGDFNCTPGSRPHRTLTEVLTDAGDGSDVGTYHGFKGKATGRRLDWILFDADVWRLGRYHVERAGRDGRWPSDHFPVAAELVAA